MRHGENLICDTDVIRNCGVISQLPINILEYTSAIILDEQRIYISLNDRNALLLLKFQTFKYYLEKDFFLR